jgi:hypothetical protein
VYDEDVTQEQAPAEEKPAEKQVSISLCLFIVSSHRKLR